MPHPSALAHEAPAAPARWEASGPSPFLRRARGAHPRPRARRPLPLVIGLTVVTALAFLRVGQVTSAHALAMEKDRLKKEVGALENRIRLSSELAVQEALREGLDYAALAKQGFHSPNPDALVDVDLAQPYPRVVSRQGAMERLSADVGRLVRGILPARREAPRVPPPVPGDGRLEPVIAEVAP